MREISAGIIVYRRTEEGIKYLILYHRGQYWNFPKGKIESEERSFQTALREVKEETGLDRKDLRFNDYFKAYENFTFTRRGTVAKEKVDKTIIFYLAETDKKQIYLRGPHEEGFGWFAFKEALKILSPYKDSQKVLKSANDFLGGKPAPARVAGQSAPGERNPLNGRPGPNNGVNSGHERKPNYRNFNGNGGNNGSGNNQSHSRFRRRPNNYFQRKPNS